MEVLVEDLCKPDVVAAIAKRRWESRLIEHHLDCSHTFLGQILLRQGQAKSDLGDLGEISVSDVIRKDLNPLNSTS